MRFIVFIIAIFITVLTVQPTVQILVGSADKQETCCADSCCDSDDSCSQDADTENQDENGCCPGGICNPFEACNCCCGGLVDQPSITQITSFIKINYNSATENNLVLGFRSECYQPPEVV